MPLKQLKLEGFLSGEKFGSEIHDEIEWNGIRYTRPTNNAGGIEGGMSNSMPIILESQSVNIDKI